MDNIDNMEKGENVMNIGSRNFDFTNGTSYIMGILNITPDSFSDGGSYADLDAVIDKAAQMERDGVDIFDVGGESTRPGYTLISCDEELSRVLPVIEALKARFDIPISVDTYKYQVAERVLAEGADMINDIWGLDYPEDPQHNMARVVAASNKPVCIMHNRGDIMSSATKGSPYLNLSSDDPKYGFRNQLLDDLKAQLDIAFAAGISRENIMIDPGVGFAKDLTGNVLAMAYLEDLKAFDLPILLGISRKSIIGKSLDLPVDQREEATVALNVLGRAAGCQIFRVHNVRANKRALAMTDVIRKEMEA